MWWQRWPERAGEHEPDSESGLLRGTDGPRRPLANVAPRRAAHRIELYIAHCPDFISHVHHVCVDLCTDGTVSSLFYYLS